jgi:CcmD family protein
MSEYIWIFAANAVAWLGIGLYLLRLYAMQARLTKRLKRLKKKPRR